MRYSFGRSQLLSEETRFTDIMKKAITVFK